MKYFKMYKEDGAIAEQVTKEEAKRLLEGWWLDEMLNDVFEHNKAFRLYTPYTKVWTMTDDGKIPEAGFYGVVG